MNPTYTRLLLFVVTSYLFPVFSQLTVNASNNAAQLAQFISGPGVEISNATLVCGNGQIGYFDATNANLDLVEGIVLDNGNINDIIGPNTTASAGGGAGGNTDPDLADIAGDVITDACILEFDVVPRGDTLKFNYQFASEEYPEFAPPNTSSFNDVFGFFFSGPGITGPFTNNAINIALIPGTQTPVGVNTINPVNNNGLYIYNGDGTDNPYRTDNAYIQYDGITKILSAEVPVDPCATYHLKLGVSDAGSGLVGPDAIYSSCVFLEKGSLVSIERELEPVIVDGGLQQLIEGCNDGEFKVVLNNPALVDKTIDITFGGTAVYGEDYDSIPTSFTIPAGQQSATIAISTIIDSILEPTETIEICLLDPCDGSVVGCEIIEIIDFVVDVPDDISICKGESANLFATGESLISWDWQPTTGLNDNTIETPVATPLDTTVYTITASNGNCTFVETVTVNVNSPIIFAGDDKQFCIGSGDILEGELILGNPFTTPVTWSPTTGLDKADTLRPTLSLSTTGTYEYIITALDAAGCTDKDTVEITVFESPDAEIVNPVDVCLNENVQLEGSGGISYSWEPASRFTNPNTDIVSLNNATRNDSTYFYLTVTDANNCTNTDSVFVTVNPLPIIDLGGDISICEGDAVGLQATGAVDYSWLPNTALSADNISNPDANPINDITYTITGTDVNGCVNDTTLFIEVFPANFATASPLNEICRNEQTVFNAGPSAGETFQWIPAQNLSSASVPNPTFTGRSAGTFTYSVVVTLSNGCRDTAVTSITVNPLPILSANPPSGDICFGDGLDVTFSGANSYSINPAASTSPLSASSFRFTPDVTTNYTVTGTDAKGCSSNLPYEVIVRGLPDAPLNDTEICIGNSTQLNATSNGGVTYTWTPTNGVSDPSAPNPTFSPNSTTNYNVNIIDIYGCVSDLQVEVAVNPLPNVDAGADFRICRNDTTILKGTGLGSAQWAPFTDLNNPRQNRPQYIPTTSGIKEYILFITDNKGCENSDTVEIEVIDLPTLGTTTPNPGICSYEDTLIDVNGANSYIWAPSNTLNTNSGDQVIASPDVTTTYAITGTDINGCRNLFFHTVTVFPDAIANYNGLPEICEGDSIQLQPEAEFQFLWTPAASLSNPNIAQPIAFPAVTTEYTFITTNFSGCSDTGTVTVQVNQNPIANPGTDQRICVFDTVQIGGNPTGNSGTPGYTYEWLPNSDIIDNTQANPNVYPTVPTNYSVIVTDMKGCDDTASVLVDTFNLPNISAGNDLFMCPEDTIQIIGTGPIGTSFNWSPSTGIFSPSQAITLAHPSATTSYILGGTDGNGCYNQDTMLLTVHPAAVAEAGPNTEMCIGGSVQLDGSGGVIYDWSPGIVVSDSTLEDPTGFPGIDTRMILRVFDANGCTNIDSTFITVHPLPTVTTSLSDTIMCDGDTIQLTAFGGVQYEWAPANLVNPLISQTTNAFPLVPTTFTVGVTDINGCYDTGEIFVDIHPDILPNPTGLNFICPEDTTVLEAFNGEFGYVWEPANEIIGSNTNNSIVVSPDVTQPYSVTIIDVNTCSYTQEFLLNVYPRAEANISLSIISQLGERRIFQNGIVKGETHQFTATGGISYEWSPSFGLSDTTIFNPFVSPDTTTLYSLFIVNENGCEAITEFELLVINKTFIYVPTAFSPNGDGEHDFFRVYQRNEFDFGSLRIFNRWGNLVFEGQSIEDTWNGTVNGETCPVGVYPYVITGTDWKGEPFLKAGNITIIR